MMEFSEFPVEMHKTFDTTAEYGKRTSRYMNSI